MSGTIKAAAKGLTPPPGEQLDTPAHDLRACLSAKSAGFTLPVDRFFPSVIAACQDQDPQFENFAIPEVRAVGRSLGSRTLHLEDRQDPHGVKRTIAAFEFRGQPTFVGFRPTVDAHGHATPYGTYELLVARENAKIPAPDGATYSDFLAVLSHPGRPATALSIPPGTCTSCHQDGMPVFSLSPWAELGPTSADRQAIDDAVFAFERRVRGLKLISWLTDRAFAERKWVALSLVGYGAMDFTHEFPEWDSRVSALIGGRQFFSASSRLASREPTEVVPFKSYYDPLVPREEVMTVGPHPAQEIGEELHDSNIVSVNDEYALLDALGSKDREFVDSRVFAESALNHWPPDGKQLLQAARDFENDPAPADEVVYQRRLDALNVKTTAEAAAAPAPPSALPQTAAAAFDTYCGQCHAAGGLAPEIDKDHLQWFVGKTPERTVERVLGDTMPPKGSSPIDASSLALLRALVGPAPASPPASPPQKFYPSRDVRVRSVNVP